MLNVGDHAPDFSLPSSDMEMRSLNNFLDQTLVLYFYPKDDTPGCTIQATDFSEHLSTFEELGATVVGISKDDCFSHQAFRDKYGLKVNLLADVDGDACQSYAVVQEREKDGELRTSILRSTFIIDRDGIIRYAEYGVSPKGHAEHLLDVLRA